jgi:hypothetical protein
VSSRGGPNCDSDDDDQLEEGSSDDDDKEEEGCLRSGIAKVSGESRI